MQRHAHSPVFLENLLQLLCFAELLLCARGPASWLSGSVRLLDTDQGEVRLVGATGFYRYVIRAPQPTYSDVSYRHSH